MTKNVRQWLREQRGLIIFLLAMSLFRSAVADWNDVPSGSMLPTIMEGDRVYVDKLAYDLRLPFTHFSLCRMGEPRRGDIVVFESARAGKRLVKRVIGLPGDVVAMRGEVLNLNGRSMEYTRLGEVTKQAASDWMEGLERHAHAVRLMDDGGALDSFGPVRVPEDHLLVLGDNRDNSADSRVYGFVPRSEVVGRVERVVVSLDYGHFFLPRGERFLKPLN